MRDVTIGAVAGVFGLKGELKIKPFVEDERIFTALNEAVIDNGKTETQTIKVTSARFYKGMWLLKLDGINNPDDAHLLRGSVLLIKESSLPKTEPDEVYWFNIKGFAVEDKDGTSVGFLEDYIETGSHDVFVIKGNSCNYMISNNPYHVLKIDIENKIVVIDRDGLVEEM